MRHRDPHDDPPAKRRPDAYRGPPVTLGDMRAHGRADHAMPPRFLGYDNFLYKFGLDGSPYVGPDQATLGKYAHWLWLLSSARFLKNHSVLCYHDGIKAALKSP